MVATVIYPALLIVLGVHQVLLCKVSNRKYWRLVQIRPSLDMSKEPTISCQLKWGFYIWSFQKHLLAYTSEEGSAYPSAAPDFTPGFFVGFVLLNL